MSGYIDPNYQYVCEELRTSHNELQEVRKLAEDQAERLEVWKVATERNLQRALEAERKVADFEEWRQQVIKHLRHYAGADFALNPPPGKEESWITHAINRIGQLAKEFHEIAKRYTFVLKADRDPPPAVYRADS